jgi:hypothetical protein
MTRRFLFGVKERAEALRARTGRSETTEAKPSGAAVS